jgi:hypothetical protein
MREKVRFVPRRAAENLREPIELARIEKVAGLARAIHEQFPKTKILRAGLNKENGRLAQILLEDSLKKRTGVLSDVSESVTPENLLSTAVWRLSGSAARRKNPLEKIWIVAPKKEAKKLQKLHALLCEGWKRQIFIKEISRENAIKDLKQLEINDLWRGRAPEMKDAKFTEKSAAALGIIALAPAEIDVVASRNGETLRFNGLPFARIRKVFDDEKVWFGVEKSRSLLSENNLEEFAALLENLKKIRTAASPNKRHAFYRDAPEAWLEAVLRRHIKRLDANLILAPLFRQFRMEREKIDLLALRKDGRLVIVELKTAPDRSAPFQAADYWRKIEFLRRAGRLEAARLFGEAKIADAPAICYIAAPTLSFHADFDFLASAIAPEIELHRFNLAENWRAQIKVLERRQTVQKNLGGKL